MIALVVMTAIVIWMAVGYLLWRSLMRPRIPSRLARISIFLMFAALWLVAPLVDEMFGAREFEKLCEEMPEIKFHGPVPVGPGAFFDEQGTPKRLDDGRPRVITPDEVPRRKAIIEQKSREWDTIFVQRDEWRLLRKWPMPIGESHHVYVDKRTGKTTLETYARYSPGGWIKRGLGWGSHAPYQCPSRGYFPKNEEWIFFARDVDSYTNGDAK